MGAGFGGKKTSGYGQGRRLEQTPQGEDELEG